MKKLITIAAIILAGCAVSLFKPGHVIIAQTLPYTITVTWDASTDATGYNCYLDGVFKTSSTALTCQMSVANLGAHVAGVTATNPAYIPSESTPGTVAFTLKQPAPPAQIKVK